jgi:hypothetical protein
MILIRPEPVKSPKNMNVNDHKGHSLIWPQNRKWAMLVSPCRILRGNKISMKLSEILQKSDKHLILLCESLAGIADQSNCLTSKTKLREVSDSLQATTLASHDFSAF